MGYNIHHLFTGAILLIFSTLLLVNRINNKLVIMVSGIGTLIADQIIYLIATDGSDAAYLSAVSLNGAIVLGILIIIILYVINLLKENNAILNYIL